MVPFLKWAGGKRWLFTDEFITRLPSYERYIEPFLGGGAGFFALRPPAAFLCDVNEELINLYTQVRDHPAEISVRIRELQAEHTRTFYYDMRATCPTDPFERAVRTLYLNRTCWNGLYRLNQLGKFNVPIGTKDRIILETDDFELASELLANAELEVADFEQTLGGAGPGDLVFVDPPYTVKHNMNGFIKYNESIFTWEDQQRLHQSATMAAKRGAHVMITNADHASIRDLYSSATAIEPVVRASVLAANPKFRSRTTELLIRL